MTIARPFRLLALCTLAALLGACGPGQSPKPPAAATPAPAARIITLDSHDDIPLDFATPAVDPATADLQVNLDKMVAGGLNAGFFIVYVGQSKRTPENYTQAENDALTKFAAIHRMAEQLYPDRIEIAYRADDVPRIVASGKLVAAIGIENGFVLGPKLEMLDRFYELGARYVTLAHDGDNDLARSARPKPELGDPVDSTAGVTALGAEAIARMNRLGIMVDISHGAKQTALDAMRLSAAPVIASHSGIAGVMKHPRNLDDETLLALRDDGGVVQVVAYDAYLKPQPEEELAALRALRERVGLAPDKPPSSLGQEKQAEYEQGMTEIHAKWPPATVADFVDHIDYAVKLIGVDHVGISSDFGGGGGVTGWSDATQTGNVTAELRRRGYSDEDIGKIWSGNILRVWRAVEQKAAELAAAGH
jgi:membrane dipeptidase